MLIARTKQDDLNLLNFCLHHVPLFLICFLFLSLNVAYMKQRYKILKKQALGDRQSFSNSPLILRRFANRVSMEISFGVEAASRSATLPRLPRAARASHWDVSSFPRVHTRCYKAHYTRCRCDCTHERASPPLSSPSTATATECLLLIPLSPRVRTAPFSIALRPDAPRGRSG